MLRRLGIILFSILILLSASQCYRKGKTTSLLLAAYLLSESSHSDHPSQNYDEIDPVSCDSCYSPELTDTWQWQLMGEVNSGYDVVLYDIDLFDSETTLIASLQNDDKIVICYFSAGSSENWRPDFSSFPDSILGSPLDDWEGERWLDIRSDEVFAIMEDRLDLAVEKGCNGVEPDNMDGYSNDSGFSLSSEDQLYYNKRIANAAHTRGLFVALKNDGDQAQELEEYFDLVVNEQCHEYDECDLYDSFITAGKPVLNAEYDKEYVNDSGARNSLCSDAQTENIRTLVLPLDLDDSFRYSCD